MEPARTPAPPYWALIFTSRLSTDLEGQAASARRVLALLERQPGFLGVERAREELGVMVSYWKDEASIRRWREQAEHAEAFRNGRERWYADWRLRVCRVEREEGPETASNGERNA